MRTSSTDNTSPMDLTSSTSEEAVASVSDEIDSGRKPIEQDHHHDDGDHLKVRSSDSGQMRTGLEEELRRELLVRDQKLAELEAIFRSTLRDREIATTLAGKALVEGAVSQLIKLWRDDFDVFEEAGSYKVSSRDGRTVEQLVSERLRDAAYAHFCIPSNRGGSNSRGLSQTTGADIVNISPRTLGESIVNQWRDNAASRPANPNGKTTWARRS